MNLILASGSPRRKELLQLLNIPFEVHVSHIDEVIDAQLSPSQIVMSLARQKAEDVARAHPESIVIGSDTIVVYDSCILGKPKDKDEAAETLRFLSGRTHDVFTGVAILSHCSTVTFYERTEVTFWDLSEQDIAAYVDTNEPLDKAGSYGIQGKGALLVKSIQGDYYSVVGLPVSRLKQELKQFGL